MSSQLAQLQEAAIKAALQNAAHADDGDAI